MTKWLLKRREYISKKLEPVSNFLHETWWLPCALGVLAALVIIPWWTWKAKEGDKDAVVIAGATATLAFITFFYVMASQRMAEEMKQQRAEAVRPVLVIQGPGGSNRFVESEIIINASNSDRLQMNITNVGKGPALNITALNIDHIPPLGEGCSTIAFANFKGQNLREIPELTFELKYSDIYGKGRMTTQKLQLSADRSCYLAIETNVN